MTVATPPPGTPAQPYRPLTATELARRYRAGEDGPVAAVERTLAAARAQQALEPPLGALLDTLDAGARAAAADSAARLADGRARSLLEGIPVAVKDVFDVAGHPTSNGTRLPAAPARSDAAAIERLRAAGAIVVAKANLHELGAGATGINPSRGTARNPHDPSRMCGGSSSGSACAVAAELVPLALGTDAGGSIRTPASLCGVVGLKPTFGRIARTGWRVLCHSLDTVGTLAHDCADTALLLAALAPGPDPRDDDTWDGPPLPASEATAAAAQRPIDDLRIGIDRKLLAGPLVEPAVAAAIERAVARLAQLGAAVREVELPDPDVVRLIGLVILGAEGGSAFHHHFGAEAIPALGADLQLLMAASRHMLAGDYLHALRLRADIRAAYLELLRPPGPDADCDVLVMPAAGCLAPTIQPGDLAHGVVDDAVTRLLVSHTFASNLTGLPALALPCGYADALPIGMQLVGRPWEELTLLRVGAALERAGASPRRRPARIA